MRQGDIDQSCQSDFDLFYFSIDLDKRNYKRDKVDKPQKEVN